MCSSTRSLLANCHISPELVQENKKYTIHEITANQKQKTLGRYRLFDATWVKNPEKMCKMIACNILLKSHLFLQIW